MSKLFKMFVKCKDTNILLDYITGVSKSDCLTQARNFHWDASDGVVFEFEVDTDEFKECLKQRLNAIDATKENVLTFAVDATVELLNEFLGNGVQSKEREILFNSTCNLRHKVTKEKILSL